MKYNRRLFDRGGDDAGWHMEGRMKERKRREKYTKLNVGPMLMWKINLHTDCDDTSIKLIIIHEEESFSFGIKDKFHGLVCVCVCVCAYECMNVWKVYIIELY
jgi:hypothetical protein